VQDYRARVVIDECQKLGLHVPHDVAVLGVDNDTTVCEFCRPPITSVSRNAWRTGYEAAAMLDLLMHGKTPPTGEVLVPPDGIVFRQSTDTVAVDDRHVAAAVHFMRDHVHEPFGIERVLRNASVSRRLLEMRFRRALRTTPHDYLVQVRVEKARQLLIGSTEIKLYQVAKAAGFTSVERLRVAFRQVLGQSPLKYRRALTSTREP
jgi:LacI family transcriptional regulator